MISHNSVVGMEKEEENIEDSSVTSSDPWAINIFPLSSFLSYLCSLIPRVEIEVPEWSARQGCSHCMIIKYVKYAKVIISTIYPGKYIVKTSIKSVKALNHLAPGTSLKGLDIQKTHGLE